LLITNKKERIKSGVNATECIKVKKCSKV
jgi:hypothetical protein